MPNHLYDIILLTGPAPRRSRRRGPRVSARPIRTSVLGRKAHTTGAPLPTTERIADAGRRSLKRPPAVALAYWEAETPSVPMSCAQQESRDLKA